MIPKLIERISESNPQLFRELKGRSKPRNLIIASGISLVGQLLVYLYYRATLPADRVNMSPRIETFNRYCLGNPPAGWSGYAPYPYSNDNYCVKDLLGHWMLNWQLWWLDIFTCLSLVAIFALLVAGSYMLIADLSREERRGTLNFIRLSPQSAKSILWGKMLGVPVMLYLAVGLVVPLHLAAGLSARIPLELIVCFYGVLAVGCAFFYSASLLFGLVTTGLGGFQPWLGSGVVLFFLSGMTGFVMSNVLATHTPFDWLALLYPGTILPYLIHATFLPPRTVGYLALEGSSSWNSEGLVNLHWYGQSLWLNVWTGTSFILINYAVWIYWLGQGLKRRFHNPLATLWSKGQSYIISGSFAAIVLGFTLQTTRYYRLFDSYYLLQVFTLFFFLILIAGLSPERQALQDWVRYRHQMSRDRRNLAKELIWGENSPSTVAIALNLFIFAAFITPSIWLFPLEENKTRVIAGLLLNISTILMYAAIAQFILMMKSQKRTVWASTIITAMIFFPLGIMTLFGSSEPARTAIFGLFSVASVWAVEYTSMTAVCLSILGQWLAIALVSFQMTRQLRKAGQSETQALLCDRQRAIVGS
ncbi:MAG: hypothetical protein MUD14_16555 [Hydrococcus sp. Prado102]|nr:hypothetical protein [Hydrococcus sp. Prado102]